MGPQLHSSLTTNTFSGDRTQGPAHAQVEGTEGLVLLGSGARACACSLSFRDETDPPHPTSVHAWQALGLEPSSSRILAKYSNAQQLPCLEVWIKVLYCRYYLTQSGGHATFEGRIRSHKWPKVEEVRERDRMVSVTHRLKLLVWIETGLTSRSEVAENLEGIL